MNIKQAERLMLRVADLRPNEGQIDGVPANPRYISESDYKALCNSLREDDLTGILQMKVYDNAGEWVVLDGNMRLRALNDVGVQEVECIVVPQGTPAKVLRKIVALSNSTFGEWDMDMLANEWNEQELSDWGLNIPGFDEQPSEQQDAQEDDFDEEKDKEETVCKNGDIWQLGNHRLMCGDSTSREDCDALMAGNKAQLALTDPPYGIDVVSDDGKVGADFGVAKKGVYKKVIADDTTETAEKAYEMLKMFADRLIIWGGNYFTKFLPFSDSWLIWDKRCESGIRNDFADGEMAWCSFHTPIRIYHQLWNGMIREGEHEKRVHPTQKPIKMLGDILKDFSKEADNVLDLFGGSGSTLIACEQLGRKCYMMELDPHYCDVIIARWEKLTGQKATRL